jgi:hypothetical protein
MQFIVKPTKKKAMEKIIFGVIAMWFSFMFTDGFQPPKPVKKPDKQHTEIYKQEPINPAAVEYKLKFNPKNTN